MAHKLFVYGNKCILGASHIFIHLLENHHGAQAFCVWKQMHPGSKPYIHPLAGESPWRTSFLCMETNASWEQAIYSSTCWRITMAHKLFVYGNKCILGASHIFIHLLENHHGAQAFCVWKQMHPGSKPY